MIDNQVLLLWVNSALEGASSDRCLTGEHERSGARLLAEDLKRLAVELQCNVDHAAASAV
jgi:hypothetical protein